MSEYQYYEFQAIDRSLTDRQMRELRAISSRAEISRTRFGNYYTFGNLKANPRDLLTRYNAAATLLQDLREIGERKGGGVKVARRLRSLRDARTKKTSLLARLRKAGF